MPKIKNFDTQVNQKNHSLDNKITKKCTFAKKNY
jgi:hypothetical protein